MTEYNALTPGYESFKTLFPMLETAVSALSSLSQGSSVDISSFVNAIKFNSGVRPLYEGDNRAANMVVNDFLRMSGISSATPLESMLRTGADYLIDDKGKAEKAARDISRVTGAGIMTFSAGGSYGDRLSGWNSAELGDFGNALSRTMADVWLSPPDDNVSKGMRQALFALQMGSDTTLVQANAMARNLMAQSGLSFTAEQEQDPMKWYNLRDRIDKRAEERTAMHNRVREDLLDQYESSTDPERRNLIMKEISGMDEEEEKYKQIESPLKKFVDQLIEAQEGLQEFSAAASDWGKMLKTDADTAVARVGDLLGVNAARAFSGQEFGYMTHMMQNAAALGGVSVERVMNMAGVAQKNLAAVGLGADASLSVAGVAALSSQFGNDYRNTRNVSEAADMAASASMMKSSAGILMQGAFQAYADQHPEMSTEEAFQEFHNKIKQQGGITLRGMQQILGRDVSFNELRTLSGGVDAQEMMAKHPEALGTMWEFAANHTRNHALNRWDKVGGRSMHLGREYNRLNAMVKQRGGEELATIYNRYRRDDIVKKFGKDLGGQILRLRSPYLSAIGAENMGPLLKNASTDVRGRLMDPSTGRNLATSLQEAQARSRIQEEYTTGGFGRVLWNELRSNPDTSLGSLVSAVTGMTLSADTVKFLSGNGFGKDVRRSLATLFSSEKGMQNRFDEQFLAGVRTYDDLVKDGVSAQKAFEESGLGNFGFSLGADNSVKYNKNLSAEDIRNNLEKQSEAKKAMNKEDKEAHNAALEGFKKSTDNLFVVADRLSVYDVYREKSKHADAYTGEKKEALDKYKKAYESFQNDPKNVDDLKEAETALRKAFSGDKAFMTAQGKALSDVGMGTNGGSIEQAVLSMISQAAQKFLKGEPIAVSLTDAEGK